MKIYLLRHAIAVSRENGTYPNDDRPLTKKGVKKMNVAALGISKLIKEVDIILSSPLTRAHNTAKIVAKALKYKRKIEISKELLPGNSHSGILEYLSKFKNKKSVMLIGHEPDLSRLGSLLLGSSKTILELKKGSLCRLDIVKLPASEPAKLVWHLTPKQLRALGE